MPADHLAAAATTAGRPATNATADHAARAVLAVLAGTPLDQAAADNGLTATDLADALRIYHQAGYAALETQAHNDWYQAHLELPDLGAIEHTISTDLGPRLLHLYDTGVLTAWWFIRKPPGLRIRIKPATTTITLTAAVDKVLTELTTAATFTRWQPTHYEPEQAAFGGPTGMDIAHELFSADTHHLVDYLHQEQTLIGRRELSILLCTALFRAAGQEWFECGDIWHRVARHRPAPPTRRSPKLTRQLHTLLSHDPHPTGPLFGSDGTLAGIAPWAAAFHHAGQALSTATTNGTLHRGTRVILAHHVIFHWNRLGLPLSTQSILAHTAAAAILDH